MNRIIGLSGYAQSGKSTVAEYFCLNGYKRFRFAEGLKNMLKVIGVTDNQIDGSEKEVPLSLLCGKTPRQALQYLGTEYGRNLIGEDFWVNILENRVKEYLKKCDLNKVVIDDIRFPNELDRIVSMGGFIIRIERDSSVPVNRHVSETSLDSVVWDNVLSNNGTKDELYSKVDEMIRRMV